MFGLNGNQRRSNGSPSASDDETVFMPRHAADRPSPDSDGSDGRVRQEARKQVALVEGSTPHLSAETRDVLAQPAAASPRSCSSSGSRCSWFAGSFSGTSGYRSICRCS